HAIVSAAMKPRRITVRFARVTGLSFQNMNAADAQSQVPEDGRSDDGSPLEHVVDDVEELGQAASWAEVQLLAGRTVEELVAELVADGWAEDDAAELVERARRDTRRQRGVLTRD